jgi:general secretion pathway protein D
LISRDDRTSSSRVPGLGDLPVLGRLFSSQVDDAQRTELVLAITPRIVRNVRPLDANESEIWVGTEAQPRLRPFAGRIAAAESSASAPEPAGGGSGTSDAAQPNRSLGGAAAPAPARGSLITTKLRGPQQVAVGDMFVVALDAETSAAVRGGPIQLTYPKDRLSLVDVQDGDLLRQGSATVNFTKTIDAAQGAARIGQLRSGATGATGTGTLIQLRFKALSAGDAEVRLVSYEPVAAGDAGLTHRGASPLRIEVTP